MTAAMELFGVTKYVSAPISAIAVWLLVARGTYRSAEKVLLCLSLVFVSYMAATVLAKSDWGVVAQGFLVPRVITTSEFIALMVGMMGATIAP